MQTKKIALITGHFNVLHAGHIRLFRAAKQVSDKLIVGVISDEIAGKKAILKQELRLEGVETNNLVDEVLLCEKSVPELILKLKPTVVFKGSEHENMFNPELEVLEEYGGKLVFSQSEPIFSAREWMHDEPNYKQKRPEFSKNYLKRHDLNIQSLCNQINKFKNLNVCVIGDLIIDEYIDCVPLGMSQEEPTIVVSPIGSKMFLGGAGIVAAHCRSLGAQVEFISVCGNDDAKIFAEKQLLKTDVRHSLIVDDSRPTTLKTRYKSNGQGLLRVSRLHEGKIRLELQNKILECLEQKINELDLLIFSDFNYGCLPDNLISKITSLAKKNKILLCADSQSSSQIGDISRFKDMDLITPTEREARIGTRNKEDGLVVLINSLRKISGAGHVILKLGADGILIHERNSKNNRLTDDKLVAINDSPIDVSGAGDSLLAVSSMVLAVGGSIWASALLGSIAASIQVSRIGNIPLLHSELSLKTTQCLKK